jgi:hypothetical protein
MDTSDQCSNGASNVMGCLLVDHLVATAIFLIGNAKSSCCASQEEKLEWK